MRLSLALTARPSSNCPRRLATPVGRFLDQLAAGKIKAPVFTSAAVGSVDDLRRGNRALGPEIVQGGVDGAYVEHRDIVLLANTLKGGLVPAAREKWERRWPRPRARPASRLLPAT